MLILEFIYLVYLVYFDYLVYLDYFDYTKAYSLFYCMGRKGQLYLNTNVNKCII